MLEFDTKTSLLCKQSMEMQNLKIYTSHKAVEINFVRMKNLTKFEIFNY